MERKWRDTSSIIERHLYAGASNKAGWLMHDLDDEDADVNTELEYQKWSAIEEELRGRIIAILEQEDPEKIRSQIASRIGYYYIVKERK